MTERKTTTSSVVKRRYNNKHYSRIMVSLDKDLVTRFKAKCAETGKSQACVIREFVNKYLNGEKV